MILTRIEEPVLALLAFAECGGNAALAARRMSDDRHVQKHPSYPCAALPSCTVSITRTRFVHRLVAGVQPERISIDKANAMEHPCTIGLSYCNIVLVIIL